MKRYGVPERIQDAFGALSDEDTDLYFLKLEGIRDADLAKHFRLTYIGARTRLLRIRRKLAAGMKVEDWRDAEAGIIRMLETRFPNAERLGCPPLHEAMDVLNRKISKRSEAVRNHIRGCSPCWSEFESLRKRLGPL